MLKKRSYRCGYCKHSWPLQDRFKRCLDCNALLMPHRSAPMSDGEASLVIDRINRRATFQDVIARSGFTSAERRKFRRLEAKLL